MRSDMREKRRGERRRIRGEESMERELKGEEGTSEGKRRGEQVKGNGWKVSGRKRREMRSDMKQ